MFTRAINRQQNKKIIETEENGWMAHANSGPRDGRRDAYDRSITCKLHTAGSLIMASSYVYVFIVVHYIHAAHKFFSPSVVVVIVGRSGPRRGPLNAITKNRVFRFFGLLHRCSADAQDSPLRCERERVRRGSRAFLPVHGEREHTRTGESRESDIGVFPATTRQDTRLLIIGFVLLFSTSNFADPLHEKPQLSRQPNEGVVVVL